jgi:hypothetical protein
METKQPQLPDDLKAQMDAAFAELRAKYPTASVSVECGCMYYNHDGHVGVQSFACIQNPVGFRGIVEGKHGATPAAAVAATIQKFEEVVATQRRATRKAELLKDLAALAAAEKGGKL